MNKTWIVFAVAGMLAAGCSKQSESTQAPSPAPTTQASKPAATRPAASRPAPTTQAVHELKKGETLWEYADARYGNGHYAKILLLVNHIKDDNSIDVGKMIKSPELKDILVAEKLIPTFDSEMRQILDARALFVEVEGELWDACRNAHGRGLKLSDKAKKNLTKAADEVDEAVKGLSKLRERYGKPEKTIGQLKSASEALRSLTAGKCDEEGKNIDSVHQHLVYGMSNAILWSRSGYKN